MTRWDGGHNNGDIVIAIETCDLFNQVGGRRQIGAPRGSRHREETITRTLNTAANRGQQLRDALGAVLDTGEALHFTHGQRNDGRTLTLVHVSHSHIDRATAVLNQQFNGTLCGDLRQSRIASTLETLRGLGVKLVAAGTACNRDGIEVSGLEQDVRGILRNLRVGAAQDTGDADDARALALG